MRRGVTLLELIVCLAIMAVIVGLLLPAVQKVRQAAIRTQSASKLKQLTLGMHTLIARNDGRLPVVLEGMPVHISPTGKQYIAGDASNGYSSVVGAIVLDFNGGKWLPTTISMGQLYYEYTGSPYQSAADPSYSYQCDKHQEVRWAVSQGNVFQYKGTIRGNVSYHVNTLCAKYNVPIDAVILDGTSNTIYFVESYARTPVNYYLFDETSRSPRTEYNFPGAPMAQYNPAHRATFADEASGDVHPVTSGMPAVARGVLPYQTNVTAETMFQCGVPPANATGKVPYSPYPGGLLVSMADGSVRMVRAGTAESVFWGCVTPAGGEVASLD